MTRRTRRRAGNRTAAVVALLAVALKAAPAKSQTLYELGEKWWNTGTIEDSYAFADAIVKVAKSVPEGIVEAAKGLPEGITTNVRLLAKQLEEMKPPEKEKVHNVLTPPVVPTELPSISPIAESSALKVGHRYAFTRKEDGTTKTARIMEHVDSGQWVSDNDEIVWKDWDMYNVYELPDEEEDEDYGGKRRKSRRKTLRRKRQWTRKRLASR